MFLFILVSIISLRWIYLTVTNPPEKVTKKYSRAQILIARQVTLVIAAAWGWFAFYLAAQLFGFKL